jgi:excisionase family DNA binding protein
MEELTVVLPEELVERIARKAAALVEREPEAWVGVPEAAAHLNAPKSRVYALVESGRLPHEKDGTRLLFRRSELDRWLENGGGRRP